MVLLTAAGLALAYRFVAPAPPTVVRFATSADPDSAYAAAVEAYARGLEAEGFHVLRRPSAGSVENIALLERGEVDLALVQGGVADRRRDPQLVSLGGVFFEPAWFFIRRGDGTPVSVNRLRGRPVAIGPEGSGTRALALALLAANGLPADSIRAVPLSGTEAAQALLDGTVDAAFLVNGIPTAPIARLLRAGEQAELVNFRSRADAYASLLPYLSPVRLPRAAVSLPEDLPPDDVTLLAPTASVLAREDIHPQVVSLLLRLMRDTHSRRALFNTEGRFPTPLNPDVPLQPDAARFYQSGVSFLQSYLPFWVAVTIERMWVLLIPLFTLLLPLMRIAPPLYTWQMERKIWRLYNKLHRIEAEGAVPAKLDALEREAAALNLPESYFSQLYTLRRHIAWLRDGKPAPLDPPGAVLPGALPEARGGADAPAAASRTAPAPASVASRAREEPSWADLGAPETPRPLSGASRPAAAGSLPPA
ncbi:TAXI family TRAP transporter solute-binding subunit [Roseomonas sp. BN140053]|uniref:TAXI family TRAP transporter solute-binding subunit n=1 Tax=Roseomonas sp. BN140053 TaxID=3391898 RepID=UPI0039EA4773